MFSFYLSFKSSSCIPHTRPPPHPVYPIHPPHIPLISFWSKISIFIPAQLVECQSKICLISQNDEDGIENEEIIISNLCPNLTWIYTQHSLYTYSQFLRLERREPCFLQSRKHWLHPQFIVYTSGTQEYE